MKEYTLIKTESMIQLKDMLKNVSLKIDKKDLNAMNGDNKKMFLVIAWSGKEQVLHVGVSIVFKEYPETKQKITEYIKNDEKMKSKDFEILVYPRNNKRIQEVLKETEEVMKKIRTIHTYMY